jgi:amino acid transporter
MALSPTSPTHRGLAKHSVDTFGLTVLGISASAPMTVLVGGIVGTYAASGITGVPLSFVVLGAAMALFAVGYLAMSRDIPNTAAFYAFLAHGLGRSAGVAGAGVALLAYNAIQISLYGLIGAIAADILGGPWWTWALTFWLAVALLGVLHIQVNARVLAVVLLIQVAVVVLFDLAGVTDPTGGRLDLSSLDPGNLLTDGVGGVLAFGVAAFVGFETIPVYREEAPNHRVVVRACLGSLLFLSLFYAFTSWAMAQTAGPEGIVETARTAGQGLPFAVLEEYYGPLAGWLGQAMLITGIFAALLSFHNVVARYVYGLAREGVLPLRLRAIGGSSDAVPIAGSLSQTVVALLTIVLFALLGADPILALFTWLSTLAALGVLGLMITTCIAATGFYRGQAQPGIWIRYVAPVGGAVALGATLVTTVFNIDSLTNSGSNTALQWVLPVAVGLAAVVGVLWSKHLEVSQPGVFAAIGRGQPKPLAVLERGLADLEL